MQRRLRYLTTFAALLALATPPAGIPADENGSANFFVGGKRVRGLGSDVRGQGELGVELSFGRIDWPIKIAVDIMGSGNVHSLIDDYTYVYSYIDPYSMYTYNYYYDYQGVDAVTTTFELDLGVRKVWNFDRSNIHPYIGGGPAFISAASRLDDPDGYFLGGDLTESELAVGWWAGGGVYWKLGRKFNLGFNLRYSKAEADFDSTGDAILDEKLFGDNTGKVDIGGVHAGFIMGWGW